MNGHRVNGLSGVKSKGDLTGEDYLFLIGLGLLILFLVLSHSWTPEVVHSGLIFWMSVTLLFLSMAPDYVNREVARGWLQEYKGSRVENFYRKVYNVTRNSEKYFNSGNFFVVGIILTILSVFVLFYTGEIQEALFGVSYGAFVRAILA